MRVHHRNKAGRPNLAKPKRGLGEDDGSFEDDTLLEEEEQLERATFIRKYFYKMKRMNLNPVAYIRSLNLQYWEMGLLMFVFVSAYYAIIYYEHFHFHVTRTYAWAGYDVALHKVGQHYMEGRGVDKNISEAMKYFQLAADQGHAEASHNLALGHLRGHHKLKDGEARRLLEYANKKGVKESARALEICTKHRLCND